MVIDLDSGGSPSGESPGASRWRRYLWVGGVVSLLILVSVWAFSQSRKPDGHAPSESPAPVLLTVGNSFELNAVPAKMQASYRFSLKNSGSTSIEVEVMGRSGQGLELVRVDPVRGDLSPQSDMTVVLFYHVVDCAPATGGAWSLPVKVKVSGKVVTQYLDLKGVGPRNLWQKDLVEAACESGN